MSYLQAALKVIAATTQKESLTTGGRVGANRESKKSADPVKPFPKESKTIWSNPFRQGTPEAREASLAAVREVSCHGK